MPLSIIFMALTVPELQKLQFPCFKRYNFLVSNLTLQLQEIDLVTDFQDIRASTAGATNCFQLGTEDNGNLVPYNSKKCFE